MENKKYCEQKRQNGLVYYVNKGHLILKLSADKKLDFLIEKVRDKTGIDLLNPVREREHVYTRSLYYKLANDLTRLSYNKISSKCQKDHASVHHSIKNTWPEIEKYRPDLVDIYEEILSGLTDKEFSNLKLIKIERELNEKILKLETIIKNTREEINKEYFSLQEKLVNIKKAAYSVELN